MKKLLLITSVATTIVPICFAETKIESQKLEDVGYFERRYKTEIVVEPYKEGEDRDGFYSKIAQQLGIPFIVSSQFGDKEGVPPDRHAEIKMIIRRDSGIWRVMAFYRSRYKRLIIRYVDVNDDKKIINYGSSRVALGKDKNRDE